VVRQFHEGMQAHVIDDGDIFAPFPFTSRVKQRCVLGPTLFSMTFSAMLNDAFQESDPYIRNRIDIKLVNLRRLPELTQIHFDRLREFMIAEECAVNVKNTAHMYQSGDLLPASCDKYGHAISTKKTAVLNQPMLGRPYQEPTVTVNKQKLTIVDIFRSSSSVLSQCAH